MSIGIQVQSSQAEANIAKSKPWIHTAQLTVESHYAAFQRERRIDHTPLCRIHIKGSKTNKEHRNNRSPKSRDQNPGHHNARPQKRIIFDGRPSDTQAWLEKSPNLMTSRHCSQIQMSSRSINTINLQSTVHLGLIFRPDMAVALVAMALPPNFLK